MDSNIQKTINRAFDVLKRLREKNPREYQEALNYVDGYNEQKGGDDGITNKEE